MKFGREIFEVENGESKLRCVRIRAWRGGSSVWWCMLLVCFVGLDGQMFVMLY
jgi:hypothetical protein